MKILHISHSAEQSGWGADAVEFTRAIATQFDVVCRTVFLGTKELPEDILALHKPIKNPDVVIQSLLPPYYEYCDGATNIARLFVETDRIPAEWVEKINTMDAAWVTSKFARRSLCKSGVRIPVTVVHCATDISKFQQSYGTASFRQNYPEDFMFLSVGEFNTRKGYDLLLRAFHSEFKPWEPVQLILKTGIPGKSPQEAFGVIESFCNEVKNNLRLYETAEQYKRELIITNRLTPDQLYSTYKSCNAYVTATRAEGWNIPLFDAMGFGLPLIAPMHTSHNEFLGYDNAELINANLEPCYNYHTIPGLYTAAQHWYTVDLIDLQRSMRDLYENRFADITKQRVASAMKDVYRFTHESIGKCIRDLLT